LQPAARDEDLEEITSSASAGANASGGPSGNDGDDDAIERYRVAKSP
jgi:hypothetical protein